MTICKPYCEDTAEDFRRLFVERFPGGDEDILKAVLDNPARRAAYDAGSVAYDEFGTVKAIHGLFPRVVYCGSERLKATSGVALAVKKDANRDFFTDFVRDSIKASGADIFLANTAIPGSRRRGAAALDMQDGPSSCAVIRERSVCEMMTRVRRLVRKVLSGFGLRGSLPEWPKSSTPICSTGDVVLTHEVDVQAAAFDDFWVQYLETNAGMVSSRTAEEVRWIFSSGMAKGDVFLVTARSNDALVGYAFCRRTDETSVCWRIADIIALKNDERILAALVVGVSAFLRRHTPATCLQITGFPSWVQPLFKRLFPTETTFGFNKCVWAYLSDRAATLCGDWVNAANGWYGCPYDGDMCLV